MKLKAKSKDCQLLVKVKITSKEILDEKELDRFSRLFLRGFLKPKIIKKNQIDYTGPVGVSLYERFKRPISRRDFLFIIEQIVVAVQKLQDNNFGINNLFMNLEYVFINETTKEVQFIYIPTSTGFENMNLLQFIDTIAYSVKPIDERDSDVVSRFYYFFKAMTPFDLNKIEAFVAREDRSVVNTIKKQKTGQSGFMTNKQQHYYDHYDQVSESQKDDDATGLLAQADDDATGLLGHGSESGGFAGSYDDDATGLLAQGDDDATGLLGYDNISTGFSNAYEEEATGLLSDETEEATGLLVDNNANARFSTLYRVLTQETISINKPVFRLGKERSYVDYFVTNNIAVSRSHADIITRGNKYYVKDLNSKNRTYINNQPLPIQMEVEIVDGDSLKLGNEEFIFHV